MATQTDSKSDVVMVCRHGNSGQAMIELLITASALIAFFFLAFEVSEIAVKEQRRFQFNETSRFKRSK